MALKLLNINKYLVLVVALLLAVIGFQQLSHSNEMQALQLAFSEEREALIAKRDLIQTNMIDAVAAVDAHYTGELNSVKDANSKLLADVRSGERRLRLECNQATASYSMPSDTPAASVGDAGAQGERNRARVERVIAITAEADEAIVQLGACQEYVKTVVELLGNDPAP